MGIVGTTLAKKPTAVSSLPRPETHWKLKESKKLERITCRLKTSCIRGAAYRTERCRCYSGAFWPDILVSFTLWHLARHGTAVIQGVLGKEWGLEIFKPANIPPTRRIAFYIMTNSSAVDD